MVDALLDSIPSSPVEQKDVVDKKDKAKRSGQNDRSAASRVDIDVPLNQLHELLGDQWSTYQTIVADFLTGRSTRQEFETSLSPLISSTRHFIRHHNDIMLSLLSNSFRESPVATNQSLGWSKKRREHPNIRSRGDPAAKRLKTEVMGLTNRERARIKNIPKPDAGHRLRPNSMIETRFAKLPRVPVTPQKINSCMYSNLNNERVIWSVRRGEANEIAQHHIDIVRGFHAPLCTESHYLPDPTSLKDRILATCLEHGLLGGLEESVPDLLINGLEIHLRNIMTSTISRIRKDRPDCVQISNPATTTTSKEVLKAHELAFSYTLSPQTFVEPSHPITRMVAMQLDDATPKDQNWKDVTDSEKCTQRVKVAMLLDELI